MAGRTKGQRSNNRWKLLANERPSGHAWFWDLSTGGLFAGPGLTRWMPHMLAVADESGEYPDQTVDGVLYLDPLGVMTHEGGNWLIPLLTPSGERTATIGSAGEVRIVADATGVPFRFAME
jgi:hypothetical protein